MDSSKPRKRKLKIRRDSERGYFSQKPNDSEVNTGRASASTFRRRKRGSSALPTKCRSLSGLSCQINEFMNAFVYIWICENRNMMIVINLLGNYEFLKISLNWLELGFKKSLNYSKLMYCFKISLKCSVRSRLPKISLLQILFSKNTKINQKMRFNWSLLAVLKCIFRKSPKCKMI